MSSGLTELMFEVFEHTADVGLRMRASSLKELLEDAARGLFSLLVVNLEQVSSVHQRTFSIPGDVPDYLLFDWLSELLYVFDTERVLFSHFDVRLTDEGLEATAAGEPMDPQRHEMDHEVKAITYHDLKARQTDDGWLAEVIVDI